MANALTRSSPGAIAAFLDAARAVPAPSPGAGGGRLIFALDATASREPSWEQALKVQGAMFDAAAALGGLAIQLVDYGGPAGFDAGPWARDAISLRRAMAAVRCRAGRTQIERVLRHADQMAAVERVDVLVLIGDSLEEELSLIEHAAGRLALRGVTVFAFLEGSDPIARAGFESIARLTGGACLPFDLTAVERLRALLGGIAAFAAGGRAALHAFLARPEGHAAQALLGRADR